MFLIKDFAFQQAFAGDAQQFGYGRVNPSVGIGGLGIAGDKSVGEFSGPAAPDLSLSVQDPVQLGSSRLNEGIAGAPPPDPLDVSGFTMFGSDAGRGGRAGVAGAGGGGALPSAGSNIEPSTPQRNPVPRDPLGPGQVDPRPGPVEPGPVPVDTASSPVDRAQVDPVGPVVPPGPVDPGGPTPPPGPVDPGPGPGEPDDEESEIIGMMPMIGPNLINVWHKSDLAARSVKGNSLLTGESVVAGLANSNLNFVMAVIQPQTSRNIHTGRSLSLVSASLEGNATIDQSLGQAAVFNSSIQGASISGTYEISARDLLALLIDSGVVANARVDGQSFAMLDSAFVGGAADDQLIVESDMGVHLKGLGNPDELDIDLDLASIGLRNSSIHLGDGNDRLLIRASIIGDPQDQNDYGIDLDLPNSMEPITSKIEIHAAAIGADRGSVITSGNGHDRIDIITAIDDYLEADVQSINTDGNSIELLRKMISLNQSTLLTGSGDDFVVLRGDVVDSTIDLGAGVNQIFVQGEIKGNSKILSEQDYVFVQLPLVRRSEVLTDADDRWEISNLAEIQNLDGRAGSDTLVSSGKGNQDAVAITSLDRGHLWSMGFESIESLELGDGNDIILMQNLGGLSGQILAGKGIDTLDFSDSWRPADVDLHAGTSSHVSEGIDSIEKVIGSDLDDHITLEWAPWLAELDVSGNGYDITGGNGADVFTLLGIGSDAPDQWNGTSGLPVFRDVDFDGGDRFAYSMDYNLDSVLMTEPAADYLPSAKQLPIAPLETLRNGWQQDGFGLGIATNDGSYANPFSGELHLLGSEGPATSRLLAYTIFKDSSAGAGGIKEGAEPIAD